MSSRVKLALRSFSSIFCGLLGVEGLLGPLDEGQDVAHAQDPAGEPVGVEDLEGVGLLAGAQELDRDAGDGGDAERGAAAGVAVDLGQDEAGHRHGGDERLGDRDGLLAGHRVDDEQRLDRLDRVVDGGDLGHERLVDAEPAGGVEDDDVADLALGGLDALAGDVGDRGARRAPGRPARRAALPSVSSWSAAAGRYGSAATRSGRRPCLMTWRASLAVVVVLPEPCRPTIATTAGLPLRWKTRSPAPRSSTSSSWTIFTTCWPAVRLCRTSCADGLLADARDEVLDDLEVDVGLEQGEADLAHGGIDVGLADPAAAGQVAEGRSQALAEGVEHGPIRTPVVVVDRAIDGVTARGGPVVRGF